jgi:type II secretory pathway component PulF
MNEQLANLLVRLSFNAAARQRAWEKLATQIKYGLTFDDGLRILQEQLAERETWLPNVYGIIRSRIANGHALGTALLGLAGYEEIMLLAAGQAGGKLEISLNLAAELLEARRKIRAALAGALFFPSLLALAYIASIWVVAHYVMPMLAQLSNPAKWTGAAAALYALSSFVNSIWGLITLVAMLGLGGVVFSSLPHWTGALRIRADSFPPWSLYRLTVGVVWLYTVSIFMRSRIQIAGIFNIMLSSSATPYLRERIQAIMEISHEGINFGDALHACGMNFPDRVLIDDLRIYAPLPGFQEKLAELAQKWLTEGIGLIQRGARGINVGFMLFLMMSILGLGLAAMSLQSQLVRGF